MQVVATCDMDGTICLWHPSTDLDFNEYSWDGSAEPICQSDRDEFPYSFYIRPGTKLTISLNLTVSDRGMYEYLEGCDDEIS